jgi:hypothetical protein
MIILTPENSSFPRRAWEREKAAKNRVGSNLYDTDPAFSAFAVCQIMTF